MKNPKLNATIQQGFEYYAGFTGEFVRDILDGVEPRTGMNVCDPFCGSGTTLRVAAELDYDVFGIDLNPVAAIASKAGLSNRADQVIAIQRIKGAIAACNELDTKTYTLNDIPLFGKEFLSTLIGIKWPVNPESITFANALIIRSVYSYIRQKLGKSGTSNPSWRILSSYNEFGGTLIDALQYVDRSLKQYNPVSDSIGRAVACSNLISIDGEQTLADYIITSPPYATRIDYVKYTEIELRFIGYASNQIDLLRRHMIGTVLTKGVRTSHSRLQSTALNDIMKIIKEHKTAKSKAYYVNFYSNYFSGLAQFVLFCDRYLAVNGTVVTVIQDSFFREHRIKVDQILKELFQFCGFRQDDCRRFPAKRSMILMNSHSRKYRQDHTAIESVQSFKRQTVSYAE